jgi:hypothetical protein
MPQTVLFHGDVNYILTYRIWYYVFLHPGQFLSFSVDESLKFYFLLSVCLVREGVWGKVHFINTT